MQNEIRELRDRAGLTQREAAEECGLKLNTYGSYERGERTPDYKTMDHIRDVLGKLAGEPQIIAGREEVDVVTVTPVTAGLGRNADAGEEELVLDRRFLVGTDIDMTRTDFVRVVGSGIEPLLTHRQIALVEETSSVAGDDLYVFSSSLEEAPSIAILSKQNGTLEIETRGVRPTTQTWEHLEGHVYENEETGQTCKLQIEGRVVAALGRPAREIARVNEAARHARLCS
jgi:transcriptional regulator with XRE-family HTH domain